MGFVAILFTDLVGSTALFDRHGDDAADALRREHFAALRAAVDEHGGREVKSVGDGLMVAFPSAVSAVRCAAAMQRAAGHAGPGLRIGIDAGEPVVDGDDYYGTPVIVAKRLCDIAGAGEILVSDLVHQVAGRRGEQRFRPHGAVRLKGLGAPVSVAEVVWRDDPGPEQPAAAQAPVTIVIADDQELLRTGFKAIFESAPDIEVVGEAGTGRTAIEVVRRTRPDVVLMDIRMPDLDGLQATEVILGDPALRTAVLMLTTFDFNEYVYAALRLGASGFLLKDAPADRLIDAIRVVAAGEALIAPSITRRLIGEFAGAARPAAGVPDRLAQLPPRELDVLRELARGRSNGEIAEALQLDEDVVADLVDRVLSRLGLHDRIQAVVLAYESGFVAPEG